MPGTSHHIHSVTRPKTRKPRRQLTFQRADRCPWRDGDPANPPSCFYPGYDGAAVGECVEPLQDHEAELCPMRFEDLVIAYRPKRRT